MNRRRPGASRRRCRWRCRQCRDTRRSRIAARAEGSNARRPPAGTQVRRMRSLPPTSTRNPLRSRGRRRPPSRRRSRRTPSNAAASGTRSAFTRSRGVVTCARRRRVMTPSIAYRTTPVSKAHKGTSAVRSRAFMLNEVAARTGKGEGERPKTTTKGGKSGAVLALAVRFENPAAHVADTTTRSSIVAVERCRRTRPIEFDVPRSLVQWQALGPMGRT